MSIPTISHWTPVSYKDTINATPLQKAIERVDDYFFISGNKAFALRESPAAIKQVPVATEAAQKSLILKIIQIFSYFTLIIPMIMLAIKAGLRSQYQFYRQTAPVPEQSTENLQRQEMPVPPTNINGLDDIQSNETDKPIPLSNLSSVVSSSVPPPDSQIQQIGPSVLIGVDKGVPYEGFVSDEWKKCLVLSRLGCLGLPENPFKGLDIETEVVREIVQKSYENGCQGSLKIQHVVSLHMFFLSMGFIPEQHYVRARYDKEGAEAVDCFVLNKDYQKYIGCLETIIKGEFGEERKELEEFLDTLSKNKSDLEKKKLQKFFLSLRCKNSLGGWFIPNILQLLKQAKGGDPDTWPLGSLNMVMSDLGKKRWAEAIIGNTPFKPFHKFEPLAECMDSKQHTQLQEILK